MTTNLEWLRSLDPHELKRWFDSPHGAWNARTERTCECVAEYAKSPLDGKMIVLHRCSACNKLMRPHMNYCPNCGAKVIGD